MGTLRIDLRGSWKPNRASNFNAIHHGHAQAVAEAIAWLAGVVLPEAIALDHECHDDGARPARGFGRAGPADPRRPERRDGSSAESGSL